MYMKFGVKGLAAVHEMPAVDDGEPTRGRRQIAVDEGLVVQADGIDDERIAVVAADRFTVPGRLRIGRMRHVEIDMADLMVALPGHQNLSWALDDVNGLHAVEHEAWIPARPAALLRAKTGLAGEDIVVALAQSLTRPFLQDRICEIGDRKGRLFSRAPIIVVADRRMGGITDD